MTIAHSRMTSRCVVLLALAPVVASAQAAPAALLFPAGTRAMGFGNAFVAGNGAEALFNNPAQIGSRGLTFSLARPGGGATMGSLATVGRVAGNNMAIGARYLDYTGSGGAIPLPVDARSAGSGAAATSFAAMAAIQRSYFGFRVGVAGQFVAEQQWVGRAAGGLFDAGVGRSVGGTVFGLSVQNVGGALNLGGAEWQPPTQVTLGAFREGVRVGTYFDLSLAAAVTRERGGRVVPAGGAELTFEPVAGWTFAGRMGFRRPAEGGTGPSALALGASFGLDALALDYAFQPGRHGEGTSHRIGLRIQ